MEDACLAMLRGKRNVRETAIKLAPLFDTEGSRWSRELAKIVSCSYKPVEARRAALLNIALSDSTLQLALKRTHDVSEDIRCAAFEKLCAGRVRLESLQPVERLELVHSGLTDSSNRVREACAKYLRWWLRTNAEGLQPKAADSAGEFERVQTAKTLLELLDVVKLKNDDEHCECLAPLVRLIVGGSVYGSKDILLYYKSVLRPKLVGILIKEQQQQPFPAQEIADGPKSRAKDAPAAAEGTLTQRISNEELLLLRMSCEYWSEKNVKEGTGMLQEVLDDVLPTAGNMREMMAAYLREDDVFAVHELMLMLPFYDYSEPVIAHDVRQALNDIFNGLSLEDPDSTEQSRADEAEKDKLTLHDQLDLQRRAVVVRRKRDLVAAAIRVWQRITQNDTAQFKAWIMADVRQMMQELADLKTKRAQLVEKSVSEQDQERRERIEKEINALDLHDSLSLTRALELAVGLLQSCRVDKSDPFLHECQIGLVREAFDRHADNEHIGFLAVQYLGLYALIDFEVCAEHFQLFCSLTVGLAASQTLKGITAVKCMFDFFMIHRKQISELSQTKAIPDSDTVLQGLQTLFYAPNKRLRFLAYEGFAKLARCDALAHAPKYMLPLVLFLGDASEDDGSKHANPIRQMLTLSFSKYTRLSTKSCRKLAKAIVLLTLLWSWANNNAVRIREESLMHRFVGYNYQEVVGPLIYRLTHAYIGHREEIDLSKTKENPVAEIVIMLLSSLKADNWMLPDVQTCLSLCLKYIDLNNIEPHLLLCLHHHWSALMEKLKENRRPQEYKSMQLLIKHKLRKPVEGDKKQAEPDPVSKADRMATIEEFYGPACAAVTEKLHRRYQSLKSDSAGLIEFYRDHCIDPIHGFYAVKRAPREVAHKMAVSQAQRKKLKEPCLSELAMTTPKATNEIGGGKRKFKAMMHKAGSENLEPPRKVNSYKANS